MESPGIPGRFKFESIELLGFAFAQRPTEALHTVVAMRKAEFVDQPLIDGDGVAPQAHLRLDPFPVWFTGRARVCRQLRPRAYRRCSGGPGR